MTPAFEAPDEPAHYAYVKQVAETATLPRSKSETFSQEELLTLVGIGYYHIRQHPQVHVPSTPTELEQLERDIKYRSATWPPGSANAGVAAAQPPLYYALESVPYALASTVLDRLQLMRLLSALMGALTAFFVFMFVREVLPGERWAWTVGGMAIALMPLLGFISGSVNPDAMLFSVSAAAFFLLARAFRRGLTLRHSIWLGLVVAIGLMTKLNFVGLLPGIAFGLVVLALRVARAESRRSASSRLAVAAGIGASPAIVYAIINAFSNHSTFGLVSGQIDSFLHGSILPELNYIWQFYLPRIPGTVNDFPGVFTTRQFWFNGYVGFYGFLDTTFPPWVYNVALVPAAVIAALLVRALFENGSALLSRASELATYLLITVGVMVIVGASSYGRFPVIDAEYTEPRYMLPMAALFGAMLALAARGAGRRWGPVAGVLIVVLFFAHDLFSQLLEISRFYAS